MANTETRPAERKGNLLVVDDTAAVLKLLTDILGAQGYRVRPLSDGELALRSAMAEPPDLILLDIRMPHMDGFEVCRRLKEQEALRDVPVIFISAASDLEDKVRAFRAGGVDYITKPFQQEEVVARVDTHVALLRSAQALRQLNETLELRVREEVARNREQDLLLNQQARLAAMGQMIHNIAHQWKQPVNALSIVLANLKDDFENRELTPVSFEGTLAKARNLLVTMFTTIDDFCHFFRPDRDLSMFDVGHAAGEALAIMSASLANHLIAVESSLPQGLEAKGYPNHFSHAVLNLIANAKEAIQQHRPTGGRITLLLVRENGSASLTVRDNGGGIPESMLPRIFDPYFTSKEQGSGIGLYMTRSIIERDFNGSVEAANVGDGAAFVLRLPLVAGVSAGVGH